ncbi:LysR family transcriptional regulator [Thioclava sp. SK-1]|uniref:LysR family transcriptional regulator n=1 Tax=Thioclava sp. SK-1 TaxID=1889770 RepID=UPI0008252104|nr:LysR family transcriptional regulator [Thioclava sp. SK-1]OCX65606.1 LysR family transcriptional regulator [Thioclava sp. SK-1]
MNGKLVWDDLQVFLAVARHHTLSAAAGQLHLGVATVSRRIERLEKSLGQPLFLRHQTGLQLTEDGTALREHAEVMEAAARSVIGGRQQADVSGTVRLATAETFATHLILPEIGRLRAAHPGLTLEIVTDIATVNLHRRDADIALRMVKPERGNVSVQRLGVLGYGLYGSADYMKGRRQPADTAAFEHDSFIVWTETQAHLPAAQWLDRMLQGRRPGVITSSVASQFAACCAGQGLAVLPHFLAQDRLICLTAELGIDQDIWLVTQSDLAQSRRVKAVAQFCRDLIATHRKRLRMTGS